MKDKTLDELRRKLLAFLYDIEDEMRRRGLLSTTTQDMREEYKKRRPS